MIIDSHVHLISEADDLLPDIAGPQTADDLIQLMEQLAVDACVVFGDPFYWDPAPENDRVAAEVARFPDRFIPVGLINPRLGPKAVSEIRRCVEELGFKGIKIRPDSYACSANSPAIYPLVEATHALGVPLLIHTGRTHWSHPLALGALVRHFPEVTIVMQHAFDLAGKYALQVAEECPNLILETSCCLSVPFIKELVESIGSKRIMFGSDSPALSMNLELQKIRLAGLSAEDEHNVLYGTAAELWGFPHKGSRV